MGWINKVQFNREGTHLAFMYHVSKCKPSSIQPTSYLFIVGIDGKDLWRWVTHPFPLSQVCGAQFALRHISNFL